MQKTPKVSIALGLHFFIGDEAQGRAVDAVAHAVGRLRIAGEHMTEMGVSGAASDLRAAHSVAQILFFHHSGALDRLCKGGPAAAALGVDNAGDGLHQLFHAPEAAARQIDDIVFGIHIGDLLVGPVKSRSVHVCFLSALFLRHSLLPDSAAAEQQHRGEKQCQYASIYHVSSFQGNQDSLRPFERHGQCSGAQQALF